MTTVTSDRGRSLCVGLANIALEPSAQLNGVAPRLSAGC